MIQPRLSVFRSVALVVFVVPIASTEKADLANHSLEQRILQRFREEVRAGKCIHFKQRAVSRPTKYIYIYIYIHMYVAELR